jgi:hypothetical protein
MNALLIPIATKTLVRTKAICGEEKENDAMNRNYYDYNYFFFSDSE